MKKICKVAMLVFAIVLLTVSCDKITGGSEIAVEQLWSRQDVATTGKKVEAIGGITLSYDVSLNLKPPFYQGKIPLKYISIGKNIGGGSMSGMGSIIMCHNFGLWRNIFIYEDTMEMYQGMPKGAVAVNNKGNYIIAECKVKRVITNEKQLVGFEIIENHYNSEGKAIFSSTFEVDFRRGFKTKETESRGKKEREYFFIWPTGLSAGL